MGLMKKLTSGLVAASLVFGLVGTAFADMNDSAAVNAAADRLVALKIVDGTGNGLELGSNLTRAQVVKIIVTAFGKKDTAALLADAPSFNDVKGHWAAGYIALAKAMATQNGFTLGYPDGTFKPEGNITFAESLALMEKFMGIQPTAGLSYPNNVIDAAVNAGIIDAKDKATLTAFPNQAINRGQAFYLADTAFAKEIAGGKSVYQKYDSATLPTVTVDAPAATTTAKEITLTGKASHATSVKVNGAAVTLAADGSFSAKVTLDKIGENTITVEAFDLVGNKAVPASAVKVTRSVGAAASIDASLSSASVTAGGTATLTVKVLDANGVEIKDAAYTVTADTAIGTFDSATGTFTAAKAPATGNLTIAVKDTDVTKTVAVKVTAGALAKLAADNQYVAPGTKVTLTPQDANGNTFSGDVTYTVDSADALISQTGAFIASKTGNYKVTAKAADGATAELTIGVFGKADHLVISAAPESVVSNGATKYDVKINVVDAAGNLVSNSSESIDLAGSAGLTVKKADGTTYSGGGIAATNGVASFKVVAATLLQGQTLTLTATPVTQANFAAGANAVATKSVTAVAQVPTSLKITAPTFTPNGVIGGTDYTVSVLDQTGTALAAGQGFYFPLSVTLTGPASLLSTSKSTSDTTTYSYTGTDVNVKVYPDAGATGAVSLAVSTNGLPSVTATSTIAYAGSAAKAAISEDNGKTTATAGLANTVSVNVAVTDAAGVPVKVTQAVTVTVKNSAGTTVDLTDSSKYTTDLTGASKNTLNLAAEDNKSFTFAAKTADTYTFTFSGGNLSYGSYQLTVNPGSATNIALVKSTVQVPVSAPTAPIQVQLYDDNGNKVKQAGVGIKFTPSSGVTLDATGTAPVVNTDANGIATVKATVRPYGTGYTVAISADNLTGTPTATINTAGPVPTTVSVSVVYAANNNPVSMISAGQDVKVRVTVKDQYGAKMLGEQGNLRLSFGNIVWSGSFTGTDTLPGSLALAYDPANGDYRIMNGGSEASVTIGKAGLQTFTVKDVVGATDVVGSATLSVNPSFTVDNAKVTEADSTNHITVSKGAVSGPFSLQLIDAYGNAINYTGKQTVTVTPSSADVTVSTVAGGGVPTTSIDSNGLVKFYVSASSSATGTPTVTFQVAGHTYTLYLDLK